MIVSLRLPCVVAALSTVAAGADDAESFRRAVAPVLERRCLACHSDGERNGGLSLQSARSAFSGGESGAAIVPGDPDSSYLLGLVTPHKGRSEMPKDGTPLSAEEVEALRAWIADGAPWPDGLNLDPDRIADADWWSLKPVVRPAVPVVRDDDRRQVRNPIDAFVLAKLREAGLSPSSEADRRTLIRRLFFDLLGLPPDPADVEAFVADTEPLAYERLVDRLLADPRYGERWARHWLDVAHYGDTHGYDKDQPRPNAWPYRDYVIRSFNDDKPYRRFVREQVAGDVLFADDPQAIVATGFLAAGPWDLISHVEVPESKIDGQAARSLDRDDFVRTTMETFASTTVGCARCHNHKFDPIRQEDYYALQAVFAAIDRADRSFDIDPAVGLRRVSLLAERRAVEEERTALEADRRGAEAAAIAGFRSIIDELAVPYASPEFGYHSVIEPRQDRPKWVQIDLGRSVPIAAVVLTGCYDDFAGIGAGFGFPPRFRIEASDDPEFRSAVALIANHTGADVPNPGVLPQRFSAGGGAARYVRVTATKLAPREDDFIFALAEARVLGPGERNEGSGAPVTALDSIDAPPRWRSENLTDGIWFASAAPPPLVDRLAAAHAERRTALDRIGAMPQSLRLGELQGRISEIDAEVAELPAPQTVYAAATEFAPQGSFRPTSGEPREIRLLRRGDVRTPGEPVAPGTICAVSGLPGRFDLPSGHSEGDRRAALADWLSSPENPLVWRSIVNRVWLYHFGRGIVDTPNDFGRMGVPPSHPEMLDWLAADFLARDGSIKDLHRLILTSAAYRRASEPPNRETRAPATTDPTSVDAENRLLWRMNRRRLEAEEVRDAVLAAAGRLDARMYGPAFQDFAVERPEHSPHYVYDRHDPNDPVTHRRSVYRFIVRSQPQPFLTTLDCADASMSVDKRNETITPLQALTLLNHPFMSAMSERFADRVARAVPGTRDRVALAVRWALAREASTEEVNLLTQFAGEQGLPNACRLILNLNEFVYVD